MYSTVLKKTTTLITGTLAVTRSLQQSNQVNLSKQADQLRSAPGIPGTTKQISSRPDVHQIDVDTMPKQARLPNVTKFTTFSTELVQHIATYTPISSLIALKLVTKILFFEFPSPSLGYLQTASGCEKRARAARSERSGASLLNATRLLPVEAVNASSAIDRCLYTSTAAGIQFANGTTSVSRVLLFLKPCRKDHSIMPKGRREGWKSLWAL